MQLRSNAEQRHFFEKQGWLQLEAAIDAKQLNRLEQLLKQASDRHPECKGRDLIVVDEELQRFFAKAAWLKLFLEFCQKKSARIAWSHYVTRAEEHYPIMQGTQLEQLSCVKPLYGAILIVFDLVQLNVGTPITLERGDVLLFSSQFQGDFAMLFAHHPVLWLAIGGEKAQYLSEPRDPFIPRLKALGYAFGDHLHAPEHPSI